MDLALIPSPSSGVLHLGPLPLRAYAFFIIIGVVLAVVIGDRRYVARGGQTGVIADVATLAVPAGIVGARIYHVLTSYEPYLDHPLDAFKVWEGGLGIWGGVAGGALGAWFVVRRRGLRFAPIADAVAPGIAVAQAVGRIGNYFNQELFGRPSDLPWALRIDPENRPDGYERFSSFQPTFGYELLWDLGVAGLVVWADRRWQLGRGRAFALYVAAYCAGRLWIEALRVDTANHVLGLRLNIFTSIIILLLAVGYLVVQRGARETDVRAEPDADAAAPGEPGAPGALGAAAEPAAAVATPDDADAPAGSGAGQPPGG